MRVVCCICHEEYKTAGKDGMVSHGVCARCEIIYDKYIDGNPAYPTLEDVKREGKRLRAERG